MTDNQEHLPDAHAGAEEYDEPLEATWEEYREIDERGAHDFDEQWAKENGFEVITVACDGGLNLAVLKSWRQSDRDEYAAAWSADHQREIREHRRG